MALRLSGVSGSQARKLIHFSMYWPLARSEGMEWDILNLFLQQIISGPSVSQLYIYIFEEGMSEGAVAVF